MASIQEQRESSTRAGGAQMVIVDRFTDGVLDPSRPMLGPVRDGGAHHRQHGSRMLGPDAHTAVARRT